MKRTKKLVVTIVIIIYLLGIVPRQVALAEETPPPDTQQQSTDPSPAPDPSPSTSKESGPTSEVSSTPDPSPSPDPNANQQNVEPSPSPSPSPDPCTSNCPPTTVDQTNDATLDNQVTDVSDTGNNTIVAPSPSPSPDATPEATGSATPDSSTAEGSTSGPPAGEAGESSNSGQATIATGDAASQVDIVNLANTNLTNSDINYHILNIFLDENGNIDLTQSNVQEFTASANLIVNQQNTGTVNNTVLAIANSGQNTIDGTVGHPPAGEAGITTGTASVVVNIINFINANLINSSWNFVLINIFGHLTGNIILPEPQALADSAQSLLGAGDISQANNADIQNNVNSNANTGNNQIAGSGPPDGEAGNIQTGDAASLVNLQTYANSNLIGGNYFWLLINNFGIWNGTFWGWGATAAQDPTYGQMLFNFSDPNFSGTTCCLLSASQENNALLTNQITSSANTGGNNLTGSGTIQTGRAISIVNLLNFVNTNIIGSIGFFGIINIFGTLDGDIGGVDHFPVPSPTPGPEVIQASQDQPEVRVAGGQLQTSMSTNVGTHVNPGDTVMFFITAKNPGTGPVYDSKVIFNLYDSNGEIGAIQTFDLGKLNPGQRANISFGLVLADTAPQGTYYAIAEAQGKVGPDNQEISSQSQASFQVGVGGGFIASIVGDVHAAGPTAGGPIDVNPPIAGSQSPSSLWWQIYAALGVLGMMYVLYRISRRPYQLLIVYGKKKKIGRLISLSASKLTSKALAFRSWFFEL